MNPDGSDCATVGAGGLMRISCYRYLLLTTAGVCLLSVSGCLSPITLNRAVTAYDEAVNDAASKQLLINIARAHHHQPIHFTGVSSIAATFDFRANAGATPAMGGEAGAVLLPIFGGSVAENPTFTIAPIEGEDFTRRLLTPFQEGRLTLLLRQGVDIDLLLRVMAKELRIKSAQEDIAYRNLPSDRSGYEMFRRVVLHLSAIQDHNQLHVEPLDFERTWNIPAESITGEGFRALEEGYLVSYNPTDKTYTLRKKVAGRIFITNYDPDSLSLEDRIRLNEEADRQSPNDVSFDIRPGHYGGDWPLRGEFRLRSFRAILTFIGQSFDEDPEYDVDKDSRTPMVAENPVKTIDLLLSDSPVDGADLSIKSHGKYYAVNAKGPQARWNREAFRLLSDLFQMTVTEVPRAGIPGITIAK
jgi:hypothetical protein